jgi:hypothetical protein
MDDGHHHRQHRPVDLQVRRDRPRAPRSRSSRLDIGHRHFSKRLNSIARSPSVIAAGSYRKSTNAATHRSAEGLCNITAAERQCPMAAKQHCTCFAPNPRDKHVNLR